MNIQTEGPDANGDYTFAIDNETPVTIPQETIPYLLAQGIRAFMTQKLVPNIKTFDASNAQTHNRQSH